MTDDTDRLTLDRLLLISDALFDLNQLNRWTDADFKRLHSLRAELRRHDAAAP